MNLTNGAGGDAASDSDDDSVVFAGVRPASADGASYSGPPDTFPVGHTFFKQFPPEDKYYQGEVIRIARNLKGTEESNLVYRIRYCEDLDEEDLTYAEISAYSQGRPIVTTTKTASSRVAKFRPREKAVHYREEDTDSLQRPLSREFQRRKLRADPLKAPRLKPPGSEVPIGYTFYRRFDTQYYKGTVKKGPIEVENEKGELVEAYKVEYDDEDKEDLTSDEILYFPREDPRLRMEKARANMTPFEKAKETLMWFPGLTEREVEEALKKVGPPYGEQAAIAHIQQSRSKAENYRCNERFEPAVGMKVRRAMEGCQYMGEVTNDGVLLVDVNGKQVRMWEVTYEDGTKDDLDWNELLQCRANRPVRTHPCRGRQLSCLELFSGCGIVSQQFAQRLWQVRSVDNCPHSNATDKVDVMSFELKDIGFVPDFIWCSPPCFTYSFMAGTNLVVSFNLCNRTIST